MTTKNIILAGKVSPMSKQELREIADFIKLFRKQHGFTQADYAKLADISENTLRKIERCGNVEFNTVTKALKPTGKTLKLTDSQ